MVQVRIDIETEEEIEALAALLRLKVGRQSEIRIGADAPTEWPDEAIDLMWSSASGGFQELIIAILDGYSNGNELMQHVGIDTAGLGGRMSSPGHQARRYPQKLGALQGARPFVTWESTEQGYSYKLQPEVERRLREVLGSSPNS